MAKGSKESKDEKPKKEVSESGRITRYMAYKKRETQANRIPKSMAEWKKAIESGESVEGESYEMD